jgi:hypothetical protein
MSQAEPVSFKGLSREKEREKRREEKRRGREREGG